MRIAQLVSKGRRAGHVLRLTFAVPGYGEAEVGLDYRPIGLNFGKRAPIVIKAVDPESSARQFGVKRGWCLLKVQDADVSEKRFEDIIALLKKEVRKLKARPGGGSTESLSSRGSRGSSRDSRSSASTASSESSRPSGDDDASTLRPASFEGPSEDLAPPPPPGAERRELVLGPREQPELVPEERSPEKRVLEERAPERLVLEERDHS